MKLFIPFVETGTSILARSFFGLEGSDLFLLDSSCLVAFSMTFEMEDKSRIDNFNSEISFFKHSFCFSKNCKVESSDSSSTFNFFNSFGSHSRQIIEFGLAVFQDVAHSLDFALF